MDYTSIRMARIFTARVGQIDNLSNGNCRVGQIGNLSYLPFLILMCLLILTGCRPPQVSQADITVNIEADGATQPVSIPAGSTVQQAIAAAGITLNELDRLDPPGYTVLSEGDSVRVRRIREVFDTQQVVIPFEHQELRNESLPEGEARLIQAGQNGLKELTYRHGYEDNLETSSSVIKEIILQPAAPEIVMLGVQT
ncbi:MAG: hypothetical protein COY47_04515, partial [Chloroflexi bacterium CG_4_10_14_0_8_um_filter_57_5]